MLVHDPSEPKTPLTELLSTLASNVRMLRAESGWSTREFADHAGLSLSTLYGIEHGKLKSVRLASTARIAKAFGVDIGVLLSPMAKPRRPWLGEEPQVVIAAALVLTRKAKGWTQDRLSQQAGVQRDIVAKVERASRDSTLLVLEKLARALEVSLADLFQVSDSGTK